MRYLIPIQLATVAVLAPALVPLHVDAQSPDGPPRAASVAQPLRSLGQPPRYQFHAGGSALLDRDGGRAGAFVGGIRKPLMNPVAGLAAAEFEAYGIGAGRFAGAGARALLGAPVLGLAAGADWHVTESRADFMLSYRTAVRRGGIFGGGSMVRID